MNRTPIAGIVAEYNPFHNGHLYQMREAKILTGAKYTVVALSGHFVERGEPAAFDTFTRARAALLCGADAVFEIPAPFSSASAGDFASYGVSLLGSLGIPFISCGVENAGTDEIMKAASLLNRETHSFKSVLQESLKNGLSYPEARSRALTAELIRSGADGKTAQRFSDLLSTPNNILAVEYARAIERQRLPLRLVTVNRKGREHTDSGIGKKFSSSLSIRRLLLSGGDGTLLKDVIPGPAFDLITKEYTPLPADAFTGSVTRRILDLKHEGRSLSDFCDVSPDMADRISAAAGPYRTFGEMVGAFKTRQYTSTRISRALMHILLGITDASMKTFRSDRTAPYARLIGFRRSSSGLLGILKENSCIPIISKAADAGTILKENTAALSLLREEAHAADLWNSVYFDFCHVKLPNLFERQIVIV